jgi:hypothetical protein
MSGITSYGALRHEIQVEKTRIGTDPDYKLKSQGGLKLEGSTPQLRRSEMERPPELTPIHNRAIFTAHGKQIAPMERRYDPDPGSPLGKLLQTIGAQKGPNRQLFEACDRGLRSISSAYGDLKSPPEFGNQKDHADDLREHARTLRNQAKSFENNSIADKVKMDGGETLSSRMKSLLEAAAQDLEDAANYRQNLPDNRPTEKSTGHFKSMETRGALKVIQEAIHQQTEAGAGPEQLQTLREAEAYLNQRIDQFEGKGEGAWTAHDPLSKSDMKRLIGEKPGKLDKLLMKIGIGSFASERKAIVRSIREGNPPPMSSSKAKEADIMAMYLAQTLKNAGVEGRISISKLTEEIHHQHNEVLNKGQSWNTIRRELNPTYGGETVRFDTELEPHSRVKGTTGLQEGQGINCHDATNTKAANAWVRTLKDKDGQIVFDQVRTGINCAYEIKDPQERRLANLERAKDTIALTIGKTAKHPDGGLYQQALEQARQRENGGDPPPIVLRQGSISHLTADPLRHLKAGMSMAKDNERMMLREQYEAQQELARSGPIDIRMMDENGKEITVKVKYEPIMFGMPVNAGGQVWSAMPGPLGELTSGHWHIEESYNDESWASLKNWTRDAIGEARTKINATTPERAQLMAKQNAAQRGLAEFTQEDVHRLAELDRTVSRYEAKIARIDALQGQVGELMESRDYRTGGHNPYKLSERLECLIFEVAHLHTTCKSDKDRCSYADSHAMDLMMKMHATGTVPGPNQPRDREDQVNLKNTVFGCGNDELQYNNVGGPGHKLKGVAQIYTEMGLKENDRSFLGFGEFTAT